MDKVKAGIKTSEFWVGLFTIVFTYLVEKLGWDVPKEAIIGTIAWAIAYIFARFGLKMKAVKLEADLKGLAIEKKIKEKQENQVEDYFQKYLPEIIKAITGAITAEKKGIDPDKYTKAYQDTFKKKSKGE